MQPVLFTHSRERQEAEFFLSPWLPVLPPNLLHGSPPSRSWTSHLLPRPAACSVKSRSQLKRHLLQGAFPDPSPKQPHVTVFHTACKLYSYLLLVYCLNVPDSTHAKGDASIHSHSIYVPGHVLGAGDSAGSTMVQHPFLHRACTVAGELGDSKANS